MKMTLQVRNTYGDDDVIVVADEYVVAPPAPDEDVEDWGQDTLFEFTGTGRPSDTPAFYEVEILACEDMPDLVGEKWEWGD